VTTERLPVRTHLGPLTHERTRAVLSLRAQGLSLDEIARHIHYCRHTVTNELATARAALEARDNTHAVHLATRAGII
jgi:DNA-binding NarL/FixJ family response regulator